MYIYIYRLASLCFNRFMPLSPGVFISSHFFTNSKFERLYFNIISLLV